MRDRLIILTICSLLLQGCSTLKVETTLVPGREISKTSLGERDVENKVIMEAIDPLRIKLFRSVSKAEFTNTEFQALKETRHVTTTYNCRNAYPEYLAMMITTLTLPLFYEFFTDFGILHGMCDNNPPTYVISTAETNQTLNKESFDNSKIKISVTPLAGESVTAQFNGNLYKTTTSSTGIADFTNSELMTALIDVKDARINYEYNELNLAARLATEDKPAAATEPLMTASTSKSPDSAESNSADIPNKADTPGLAPGNDDSMAVAGAQNNAEVAVKKSPPEPGPEADTSINALSEKIAVNAKNSAKETENPEKVTTGEKKNSIAETEKMKPAMSKMAEKESFPPKVAGEWKITLNIKFDTNKARIRKEYLPKLNEIGEALTRNPGLIGVIEGHTDSVGSKEINRKISVRRAEAVAKYLMSTFKISADRLRIEGYGMSRPTAENSTPNGRAKNRRIEAKFKE